tara:strand:- start:900 stop:1193 length:294 start_codon:yes stop_codon:yes gene_type:complete
MGYDHDAIRKAYPEIFEKHGAKIDDDSGVFDSTGNSVTLDQSKVDAARIELDKLKYRHLRSLAYPDWDIQLEYIYDHGIEKWKTDLVDPVKNKYPKP